MMAIPLQFGMGVVYERTAWDWTDGFCLCGLNYPARHCLTRQHSKAHREGGHGAEPVRTGRRRMVPAVPSRLERGYSDADRIEVR